MSCAVDDLMLELHQSLKEPSLKAEVQIWEEASQVAETAQETHYKWLVRTVSSLVVWICARLVEEE